MIRRAFVFVFVFLVGCGDALGLSGYTMSAEGGQPIAATDAATPPPPPPPVVCTPRPEDCTNNKDDNCDGRVDCADPACQAFACVPIVPPGWTVAAYSSDNRPPCSDGYGLPVDLHEGIDAPDATCDCTCTTDQPSCAGNLSIRAGNGQSCSNTTNQSLSVGACTPLVPFWTNNQNLRVAAPMPSGGGCTPTATKNVGTASFVHDGRACTLSGSPGGGCGGGMCVARTAPFAACIYKAGANACPAGYPTAHVVGTKLDDTRDCSACTCTFDPKSCGGTATLYGDSGCTTGSASFPVDDTCHAANSQWWKGATYAPFTSATCTPAAATPIGQAHFSDVQTICCTP